MTIFSKKAGDPVRTILIASKEMVEGLTIYCRDCLPEEACGVILGADPSPESDPLALYITGFYPMTNKSADPRSQFRLDPREWTDLLFRIQSSGQQLAGLFHSHPVAPALPSGEDLQTLWYTLPSYWILSFRNQEQPDIKAYRILQSGQYSILKINVI